MALVRLEVAPSRICVLGELSRGGMKELDAGGRWRRAPICLSCDPTVVVRYVAETGVTAEEVRHPSAPIAKRFSGGRKLSRSIRATPASSTRGQFRRWRARLCPSLVLFDCDWRLARLSRPFHFRDRGIEFCADGSRRRRSGRQVWSLRLGGIARAPAAGAVLSLLSAALRSAAECGGRNSGWRRLVPIDPGRPTEPIGLPHVTTPFDMPSSAP